MRHIRTLVVNVASSVHVHARSSGVGLVEELARDRVGGVVRNVVVSHQDDVVFWDAVGFGDLVCVASIGLVAIVAVGVRSSNDDSPMIPGSSHRKKVIAKITMAFSLVKWRKGKLAY